MSSLDRLPATTRDEDTCRRFAGARASASTSQRFREDVARLSARGREVVAQAREEFERDGVPLSRLLACQDEHDAGTESAWLHEGLRS